MDLQGKVINFLGDSITQGYGTTGPEFRYDTLLRKVCGLKAANNYGLGGTCIAYQHTPTAEDPKRDLYFCARAAFMEKSADVVIVFGGVNDYLHGDAPIGTQSDKTPETFCGAVWHLMHCLKKWYDGKPIVFITPAHCNCWGTSDQEPSKNKRKRADAMPLLGYVEMIEQRAKEFEMPVLNLFDCLGIDPNNLADKEKYTIDGLHFNNAGHAVLAQKLELFLKAL